MPNVGPLEIVVILLILLVIFGPRRIPELGRSIGQGMRNFKESVSGRDRGEQDRELASGPTERGASRPAGAESATSAERRVPTEPPPGPHAPAEPPPGPRA